MTYMIRTTVYLDEDQVESLKKISVQKGDFSAHIRTAVSLYLLVSTDKRLTNKGVVSAIISGLVQIGMKFGGLTNDNELTGDINE